MGSRSALTQITDGFLRFKMNLTTDIQTINNGPCVLRGIYINVVTSAHVIDVNDSGTGVFKIPVSASAGTWYPFGDTEFLTSLVIDPDNAATGEIVVVYQPYPNS